MPRRSDPTPPESLVVALCRRDAVHALAEERLAGLRAASYRSVFHEQALRHGVLGLVLTTLERSGRLAALPAESGAAVLEPLRLLRRQAAIRELEQDRVLEVLRRRGLRPVVLKGGALRGTVYADPVERQMGDLDILVPVDRIEAAVAALEGAGYRTALSERVVDAFREHHFHVRVAHPNGFIVEVHWGLTRPSMSFRLDAEAVLARAVRIDPPGRRGHDVPCVTDMMLHMATQNIEDAFARLRRIVDLDRLIAANPELDWDGLRAATRAGELDGILAVSLQLGRRVLGTPVPDGFLERLRLPRSVRAHLAVLRPVDVLVRQRSRARQSINGVLRLWLTVGGLRRLAYLRAVLGTTDDPLRWVPRDGGRRAAPSRRWWSGPRSLLTLLGYHVALYVRAAAALLTPAGRLELRFWSPAPDTQTLPASVGTVRHGS